MIPARISLKNFLTFAAEADGSPVCLDFEGAVLWSIAGANGAGKSAIFDAVCYALYGEHRGGRQQDNRLIRKGTDAAEVVFEFVQAGTRYRVERSVTRKVDRKGQARPDAKHVQASRWDDRDQAWIPVPDTDKPTELERWIRSLLGMGSETFRSSVLLRQGEADRLLNAKPIQRFQILAGLIDLRAYQRLEQLAGDRQRAATGVAAAFDQQLAEIPEVSDEDLATAATLLTVAEQGIKTAEADFLAADRCCENARRYAKLSQRRHLLVTEATALEGLINDGPAIRRRAQRHSQLEQVVPAVKAALKELDMSESLRRVATDARNQLAQLEMAGLQETADERALLRQAAEDNLETVAARAAALASVVMSAKVLLRWRVDHAARAETLRSIGDPAQVQAGATELAGRCRQAVEELEVIRTRRDDAIGTRGTAESAVEQARARLSDLDDLAIEPVCSRCGQPITAEHLEREREEAQRALHDARSALRTALGDLEAIQQQVRETQERAAALDRSWRGATARIAAIESAAEELHRAEQEVATAEAECHELACEPDAADLLVSVSTGSVDGEAAVALRSLNALLTSARTTTEEAKTARDSARREAKLAQESLDRARAQQGRLSEEASIKEEQARSLMDRAEMRIQGLPGHITTAVRARHHEVATELETELQSLAQAPAVIQHLEAAQARHSEVASVLLGIDQDAATIPAEHRLAVDVAEGQAASARQLLNDARTARDTARDESIRLTQAHRARQALGGKLADARQRAHTAKRLASLLGRGELQGRLLSDATAGVEAYANDALTRISAGTLEVSLQREGHGEGSQLDILVSDRSSADQPLEVSFISGSQKFRVAVALAAGLGQYLGGATAIRSLIIDEGFGSLDADGRQRMIEELRELAHHLDRIIVVSHQEDFSDRTLFPTGFILHKDRTQTLVERIG